VIHPNPSIRRLYMPRPFGRPGCAGPCTPRLAPLSRWFTARTGPPKGRHRYGESRLSNTVSELRQKCGVGPWEPSSDPVRIVPVPRIAPVPA
jgi:hypothetical protein